MKATLFSAIILCILSKDSSAQKTTDKICQQQTYVVLQQYKGDTILITCDTAFILSSRTFKLLNNNTNNYQYLRTTVDDLLNFNDSLQIIYQDQIRLQNQQYESLNQNYQSLAKGSQQVISDAQKSIGGINSNLDSIQQHILNADVSLNKSIEAIKRENKNKTKIKFTWGLGGMAVGVGITALLLLL